jgi:hypothetical protein
VKVQTLQGLVERAELTPLDIVAESEDARVIATEWYREGVMVRRDVWVNGLRAQEITGRVQ